MSEISNLVVSSSCLISLCTALTLQQMCQTDSILKSVLIFFWGYSQGRCRLNQVLLDSNSFISIIRKNNGQHPPQMRKALAYRV